MDDRDHRSTLFGNELRPLNRRLKRGEVLSAFSTRGLGTLVVFGHDKSCRDIAEHVLQQSEEIRRSSSSS